MSRWQNTLNPSGQPITDHPLIFHREVSLTEGPFSLVIEHVEAFPGGKGFRAVVDGPHNSLKSRLIVFGLGDEAYAESLLMGKQLLTKACSSFRQIEKIAQSVAQTRSNILS